MVELRFFKRDAEGILVPLKVSQLQISGWEDSKPVRPQEHEIRSCRLIKAYAHRAGAAPPNSPGHMLWWFGKTYHVQFWELNDARPADESSFESLVTIPESIPKGHIWQVPIVADKPFPTLTKHLYELPQIQGRITTALPAGADKIEVDYYDPKRGEETRQSVRSDGTFSFGARELGGDMRVTECNRSGEGWMHIGAVDKRQLELPRDADLVVRKEDLVAFEVRVPANAITDSLAGLFINVHPSDRFPMSWQVVRRGEAKRMLDESGKVAMRFVPGTYHLVGVYFDQVDGKETRRLVPLGRLVITKDSAGKTLEVVSAP